MRDVRTRYMVNVWCLRRWFSGGSRDTIIMSAVVDRREREKNRMRA